MEKQNGEAHAYDERAQLMMCVLYILVSAFASALAVWIGWTKASFFGAGIGFLIYLTIANAGTLLSLIRKPELFPFFLRAGKFRAAGCGLGTLATLASTSGDGLAVFIGTISAIAASLIANELTLIGAAGRHPHEQDH